MFKISFIKKRKAEIVSLGVVIVSWQLIADFVVKDSLLLPSFTDVLISFHELWKIMLKDSFVSLLHFGMGLGEALCIGIPLGAITGWFKNINRVVDPFIQIFRPIPPIAWIPFAILWFHLTHYAASFIIFIGAVFPILINTHSGIRSAEKVLIHAAKVLGCTRDRDLIKSVAFPSALPSIVTGIRVGMGVGWMCVVAAEMFGITKTGLGYRLWNEFYYLHQMDRVLLYMIGTGLIFLFLDYLFRHFTKSKLLRWRRGITY